MATLAEIRQQYPQYSDMSDDALAGAMHRKFYSDMPRADFDAKIGLKADPGFAEQMAAAVTDVPTEIASEAGSALSSINARLNPFSEEYRKRIDAQAAEAQKGNFTGFSGIAETGKGLAAIPALAASPITGAARSLIGHPYSALTGMPYEDAKGAVDTAMMAVSPRAAGPAGMRAPARAPLPTPDELKAAARSAYQSPEVKGLRIDPYSTDLLASKIEMDLRGQGFRPTSANAQGTFASVDELRTKGRAASVDDIDSARKSLGQTAKQRDAMGQPTPDAAAAQKAIRAIDDYLANINPVDVLSGNAQAAQAKLLEARGNYSAGKRASEIDFRLNKAERQAAKSGSGMNLENARRQKIDQVSDYGLTPAEIAKRDQIALGTTTRNSLRTVGKLGVDGGLSLMLNAGAAIGSGGATLPVTAAGTLARLLGQRLTKAQIKELNEMIRERAPLSQARPNLPAPSLPPRSISALYPALLQGGLLSPLNERR